MTPSAVLKVLFLSLLASGAAAQPELAADIFPGPESSRPTESVFVDGILYFPADDGVSGRELWAYDEASGEAALFYDFAPGADNSFVNLLGHHDGWLYVRANDGATGNEPWRVNLASGEAELIADIQPGRAGSNPFLFAVAETGLGSVFFSATGSGGSRVWAYTPPEAEPNGQAQGNLTTVLDEGGQPLTSPAALESCESCTERPGALWMLARVGQDTDVYALNAGATRASLVVTASSEARWLLMASGASEAGGDAAVTVQTSPQTGDEPAVDDIVTGARRIYDIRPGPEGSNPGPPVRIGDALYLDADDGARGRELWRLDLGTGAATLVADIRSGPEDSYPGDLEVGDRLYFRANDGVSGSELWAHDPASGVTQLVADILPGNGFNIDALTATEDRLYFAASDGQTGNELWTYPFECPEASGDAAFFRTCNGLPGNVIEDVAAGSVGGQQEAWVATTAGLGRYRDGTWDAAREDAEGPLAIAADRLYARVPGGVGVFDGQTWATIPFSDEVFAIEASETTLWVGNASGVTRLSPDGLQRQLALDFTASRARGDKSDIQDVSIVQPTADLAWVGIYDANEFATDGGVTNPLAGGVYEFRRPDGARGGGWSQEAFYKRPNVGLCLEQTVGVGALSGGVVWAAYDDDYCRFGPPETLTSEAAARRKGRRGRKMARYDGSTWTPRPVGRGGGALLQDGLSYIEAVAADPARGLVWAGGDGLAYSLDPAGDAWVVLSAEDLGVPDARVLELAVAEDGTVWAATPGGLIRYTPSPEAPALGVPASGAASVPLNPRVEWQAVAGADAYDVEVLDGSGGSLLSETIEGATALQVAAPLAPNADYSWRVRARAGGTATTWSEAASFSTGGRRADLYTHITTDVPGERATGLAVDASGRPWVTWGGSEVPKGVSTFSGGAWQSVSESGQPYGVAVLEDGRAVVAFESAFVFGNQKEGGWTYYEAGPSGAIAPVGFVGLENACFGDCLDTVALSARGSDAWVAVDDTRIWSSQETFVLAAPDGGVEAVAPTSFAVTSTGPFVSAQTDNVRAYGPLLADGQGGFWTSYTAPEAEIIHYDSATQTWTGYGSADGVPDAAEPALIDASGVIWARGPGGLVSFDGSGWTQYTLPGSQEVWAVAARGSEMWAATPSGLAMGTPPYAPQDWTLTSYPDGSIHPSEPVAHLVPDDLGNVWIAARPWTDATTPLNGGVSLLNRDGPWARWTRAGGALPSDQVVALAAGSDGSVWIATSRGVVQTTASGVFVAREDAPEAAVSLGLPHPNPARGSVRFPFRLGEAGETTVELFDVLGRRVAVLASGAWAAGEHVVTMDTRGLAAGAYVVRLKAGEEVAVRRLTVVR